MATQRWEQAVGRARAVARWLSRPSTSTTRRSADRHRRTGQASPSPAGAADSPLSESPARSPYPGDFTGAPPWEYAPKSDGLPDPGEVVWAWVPYEEDHGRGKDRPALVIGRDDSWLLAMALTSKDHDRDAAQEARQGRYWVDVGSGKWDRSGRPSEARVDRVVRLEPTQVRREGAALSRERFDEVVAARLAAHESAHGPSA